MTLREPALVRPLDPAKERLGEPIRRYSQLAAEHGRTGVAPFLANPDLCPVDLLGGAAASGYKQVRRWAVTPGDVVAPEILADVALAEYLDVLASRRLRPAFLAIRDPLLYAQHSFDVTEIADEAIIDLPTFSLAGSKRANLRHSTTSARRAGLSVVPYADWHEPQIKEISQQWLRTKRGGELGFTLSRHDDVASQIDQHATDVWVTVDQEGVVQAWCSWRHYLAGTARVLDIMRRRCHAPNPAMDGLLATVLENYRDAGLAQASLASVPRDHGAMAARLYPTRTLRAYKQKFNPRWEPRFLAVPAARQRVFALAAVGAAYCPGGLRRAALRNH